MSSRERPPGIPTETVARRKLSSKMCVFVCVSLLVLGLRNMEGSCDPTKLVSQFLLRKTLVQVRRRILQCCRPGSPDNIVKVTLT